jgi:hypothetical protein
MYVNFAIPADKSERPIQPNLCNSKFHAVHNANMLSHGHLANGAGAVKCARHTFVLPNGVGDLQRGERYGIEPYGLNHGTDSLCKRRYSNMDYIVFSGIRGQKHYRIVFSYDIACQWSKNLGKRLNDLPPSLLPNLETLQMDGVPPFHIPAHSKKCQSAFSFHLLPGVGRTCGETVETEWAHINPVSVSTKEMSPYAREETLDDHWNSWNHLRRAKLGSFVFLHCRLTILKLPRSRT